MGGGSGIGSSIDSYKQQVIDPGDMASAMAFEMNKASFGNCQAIEVIEDSRPEWQKEIGVVFKPHINEMMNERVDTPGGKKPVMWMIPTTDGGGHKPEVDGALGTEEGFLELGGDLVIMQDHDILRRGGKPCWATNFYDAKAITDENVPLLNAYFTGYGNACREAAIASITGESAVVRYAVTAFCDRNLSGQLLMNVAGTCVGIAHIDKYLDGSGVREKMPIVGCSERGGRCNGFTLAIDIILAIYGPHFYKYKEAMDLLRALSVSSQSYSKTIQRVHGWNDDGTIQDPLAKIVAMYHITGGGIWNKLRLPAGIGAVLDNMPEPPPVLLELQELSWAIPRLKLVDYRAHSTFHGGIGYAVILETEEDASIFIKECAKDGTKAQRIGVTRRDQAQEILIHESKFKQRKRISSLVPE